MFWEGSLSEGLQRRAESGQACLPVRAQLCRHNSLLFVGRFPQLVRRHPSREVVVLHDVLEVEVRHHLKLEEEMESVRRYMQPCAKWQNCESPVPHLPTSLNTLSRFVAFMMKSGYPTMLYMASACDQTGQRLHKLAFLRLSDVLTYDQSNSARHNYPTFSFAAILVSESIQPTCLRLSSNAHLISATIPPT